MWKFRFRLVHWTDQRSIEHSYACYMVLLRTYSCTITDSIGVLKCKVLEHYSSVCAAREVTEWLFFSFLFLFCVLFIVYFLCTSADLANKRVHIVANKTRAQQLLRWSTVWLQQTWAEKWVSCCAPFLGELGPHLTQCRLGRGLPPYQVASWSIQPFGHNTPTLQTDIQDRQDNGPAAYGEPLLVTVAQKSINIALFFLRTVASGCYRHVSIAWHGKGL